MLKDVQIRQSFVSEMRKAEAGEIFVIVSFPLEEDLGKEIADCFELRLGFYGDEDLQSDVDDLDRRRHSD